jgi:DNA-binding NtrC family response regulator
MSAETKGVPRRKILIIDDSEGIVSGFQMILQEYYEVKTSISPLTGLETAKSFQPDLILLDVVLKGYRSGIEFSYEFKKVARRSFIVLMTGFPEEAEPFVPSREGPDVYIVKDAIAGKERLLEHVRKYLSSEEHRCCSIRPFDMEKYPGFMGIVGQTQVMKDLFHQIQEVAPRRGNVLICGETGTGKELVARAIHACSARNEGPFVAANSAALGSELATTELFGHVKGAFTGATTDHRGKFHQADNGSLFLDEIGSMPCSAQSLLLRAIEAKAIERVGGETPEPADTRVISATNCDLSALVSKGGFRQDLFYRLCGARLTVPGLRDRPQDIPFLAQFFLDKMGLEPGLQVKIHSVAAIQCMQSKAWPGNIREFETVVTRSFFLAPGSVIGAEEIEKAIKSVEIESGSIERKRTPGATLQEEVDKLEKDLLADSLKRNRGNIEAASIELGIHRTSFYRKMKKHGLQNVP